jgi:hypothetical protein
VNAADLLLHAAHMASDLDLDTYGDLNLRELVEVAAHTLLDEDDPALEALADYLDPHWHQTHDSAGQAIEAWQKTAPRPLNQAAVLGQAAIHTPEGRADP